MIEMEMNDVVARPENFYTESYWYYFEVIIFNLVFMVTLLTGIFLA